MTAEEIVTIESVSDFRILQPQGCGNLQSYPFFLTFRLDFNDTLIQSAIQILYMMVHADSDRETIVLDIVHQVAEREDCAPLDLPPLFDAIDADLIPILPEEATIEFPYCDYMVTIEGTETVRIRKITDEASTNDT